MEVRKAHPSSVEALQAKIRKRLDRFQANELRRGGAKLVVAPLLSQFLGLRDGDAERGKRA